MTEHQGSEVPVWASAMQRLRHDDRITPQLEGFLNLAVAQGVMGGILYLDVPNELTASMINTRGRAPILEALTHLGDEVTSLRVAVNPEVDARPSADEPASPVSVQTAPSMV